MGQRLSMMWKVLPDSVEGTSHARTGAPCQDSYHSAQTKPFDERVLVLACSDGAGSAELSQIGSELACRHFVSLVCDAVQEEMTLQAMTQEVCLGWYEQVRCALSDKAQKRGVPLRQLACTLLTAVVGESEAVFAQIGDGSIVIFDQGPYKSVFWPQTGEYANTTNFLTEARFESAFEFVTYRQRIDELAMFTDGLQRLALNFAERKVHQPFFSAMFAALRAAENSDELAAPLRSFLRSPSVNERTDDDKTLILATRLVTHGAAASL